MRVVCFSEARRIYLAFTETFLHPKTDGSERNTKSGQLSSSLPPPPPRFVFYSRFPTTQSASLRSSFGCFTVLLPERKRSDESYTFLSRVVAGQTTRRIARELHVQSTHHQSGTIDTRESSRKFRLNHHHGTFNALLSSSIGAFYVRFDPPTTAPSGALEKCAKNDDDDDAK